MYYKKREIRKFLRYNNHCSSFKTNKKKLLILAKTILSNKEEKNNDFNKTQILFQ